MLADLCLEVIDQCSQVLDKEGPRVDEKHSVHHHHNEAIPVCVSEREAMMDWWLGVLHLQPAEPPSLGVLEIEGVRENVAAPVLPKHDGTFSARAHLTVEAAHTCLSQDAVKLRLLWVLSTDVADLSASVH